MIKSGVVVEKIMGAWTAILNSTIKELYNEDVINYSKLCVEYPDFLKYVESTILDQVKEKIVCVWTVWIRHFSNTKTNRVESAHAALRSGWVIARETFVENGDTVNEMLQNQHNEIQTTFGRSKTILEHQFKDNTLYTQLVLNHIPDGIEFHLS